jgi:hypothetical protein
MPFCADFGPLNLGKTDKACEMLKELLTSPKYHRTKLVYYTSLDANETTNAIFLLGSFLVLHLSATSEDAWAPFCTLQGAGVCVLRPVKDCWASLRNAFIMRLYDPTTFDDNEYLYCKSTLNLAQLLLHNSCDSVSCQYVASDDPHFPRRFPPS